MIKKNLWLKAFYFIGAGAGAGEKNIRSQSKMDWLCNTAALVFLIDLLGFQATTNVKAIRFAYRWYVHRAVLGCLLQPPPGRPLVR